MKNTLLQAESIQFEQTRLHATLLLALINQEVSVTLCVRSQHLSYSALCIAAAANAVAAAAAAAAAAAGRCYCCCVEGRFSLNSYK